MSRSRGALNSAAVQFPRRCAPWRALNRDVYLHISPTLSSQYPASPRVGTGSAPCAAHVSQRSRLRRHELRSLCD